MAQKLIKRKTKWKSHTSSARGIQDAVKSVDKANKRTDLPEYNVGDTVKVMVRIIEGEKEREQAFEGTVICKSAGRGVSKTFTVRKISHNVGVERIFMENSPKVASIKVMQPGRVRRAKLYYLRGLVGRAARVEKIDVKG